MRGCGCMCVLFLFVLGGDEVDVSPRARILEYAEVIVRLARGFGVRIVEQDRRCGRVARPRLRWGGGSGVLGCQGRPWPFEVFDGLNFAVCCEGKSKSNSRQKVRKKRVERRKIIAIMKLRTSSRMTLSGW